MFNSQIFAVGFASLLIMGSANTTLAQIYPTQSSKEMYQTQSNQVVITGLLPKTKYKVKTLSFKDREGTRTVTTNACGVVLISNGTGYKKLLFENETITPKKLPLKEYGRCNVRKKK
jgi:chitodextrinase